MIPLICLVDCKVVDGSVEEIFKRGKIYYIGPEFYIKGDNGIPIFLHSRFKRLCFKCYHPHKRKSKWG